MVANLGAKRAKAVSVFGGVGVAALVALGIGQRCAQATFESGLVDFQWVGTSGSSTVGPTMTGAAVLGSSGDVWNQIVGQADQAATQVSDQTLYLTNGSTASGAYITTPAYGANNLSLFEVIYGAYTNPNSNLFGQQLLNYSTTSTAPFATISGLNPGQTYNLYLYSASISGTSSTLTNTYSIVGSGTYSASITPANAGTYTLGINYAELSVKAGGGGDISLAMNAAQISGFQLQAVPEPSVVALLGLAGAGLLLLARPRGLTWRNRRTG